MKRLWYLSFGIVFVIFAIVDFFIFRSGIKHWWEGIPGFFAIFGVVFCVLIVLISKALGHYWLQRKENYYDRNDNND